MRLRSSLFACCGLLVQLFGMAVFLRGFFPVPAKSFGSVKAKASDVQAQPARGLVSNWTQVPSPLFGRVVIMLVDALREDFVFGSKGNKFMPYTQHLVERGSSHNFIAKAWPPTVTMPRIKAMMTGKIPGFIDIIMNLNSAALLEDNLIWQAKAAGKTIVFYGDDTWIRMFPDLFVEHDGTTSFFVSDYTEVDENVTRHLDKVLKRDDWDLLILHYLGLDHIGHLAGPNSHLIGPKLSEMDNIVQKIHVGLVSKENEDSLPSLLILCADHGMSDTGSHGGSSNHEVNTPLVLISPAFRKKYSFVPAEDVEQTDLTSTLALGFGLPIPQNNLGHLILSVFEERSLQEQLKYLHLNGYQLSLLIQESIPTYEKDAGYKLFQRAQKSHSSWIKLYLEGNTSETLANLGKKVLQQYLDAVKFMSSSLKRIVAQYDMYSMVIGAIIVVEVVFLLVASTPEALGSNAEFEVPVSSPLYSLLFYLLCLMFTAIHVVVCTSITTSCYFCSVSWLLVGTVIVLISALQCVLFSTLWKYFANGKPQRKSCAADCSSWSELDLVLLLGTFAHILSLGSSSFIEEEHQTWFFLVNTLLLVFFQDACRKYFGVIDPKDKAKKWIPEDDCNKEQTTIHGLFEASYLDPKDDKSKDYIQSSRSYEKWLVISSPWVLLVICRVLRSLNQTGIKYAQEPDFGHWLTSSNHRLELSMLTAISLVLIFILVQKTCSFVSKAALALGLVGIYCYRAALGNVVFPWKPDKPDVSKGIIEARFVYVFILGILFTGVKDLLKSGVSSDSVTNSRGLWEIYNGLVLLAALLLRPHNLPVLLFILVVQIILTRFIWRTLGYDAAQITIIYYWFGQASFYFQGNSNSIATVDISAGFVGFEDYVELPAIFLTIFSTYVGPLLWAVHLTCYMSSERSRYSSAVGHSCYCFILLRAIPASVYIILITSLRYHLFIWSVFSPKLLYEGMHTLVTAAVCIMFTAMDQKRMLKMSS
ncbi:GPI ethanolamine phosphate transferase 2 isoform X3 [Narcine bancroftii]